jgi:DNA-binding XRE family transcriptional regulator
MIIMKNQKLLDKIGNRVKTLRSMCGISRIDLSRKSGIHKNTLYLIEKCVFDSKISTIYQLAKTLKIKLSDLLK